MSALVPISALVAAMLSFQVGAALAKTLFAVLGVEATAALRLGFGALILFVAFKGWKARVDSRNWQALLIYGLTLAGMNIMYYLAISRLPMGIASAIEFLGPLAVAVIFSRKLMDFLWVGLAATGLLLLTPLARTAQQLDPIGILWALGAAIAWALYIIFGKAAGQQHGARATALGMSIAAMVAIPVGLRQAESFSLDFHLVPTVLGMTLLANAIPFTLEMFALRNLPARSLGTLMSLEPAISALVGFAILREWLTSQQVVAIGLIVIASIGTAISAQSRVSQATGQIGSGFD